MKKITFCLIFSALLAFGQRGDNNNTGMKRMDRPAADQAWSAVGTVSRWDMPSITGGGLPLESEANGYGRKVWLSTTESGSYLVWGNGCDGGGQTKLAELVWENPAKQNISVVVFDTAALNFAIPFLPQICSIDAFRIYGGRIEKSSVDVNPWATGAPKLQFAEGTTGDGRYYIVTPSQLPDDAVVIIGRSLLATDIQRSPYGTTIVFGQDWLPPAGPITVTVCSANRCGSTTFERKAIVQPQTFSGGKG